MGVESQLYRLENINYQLMSTLNWWKISGSYEFLLFALLFLPTTVFAQWTVVAHQESVSEVQTTIAHTTNASGYSFEIYRDSGDAIRSRLTMADGLIKLADKKCPTYQIDKGMPQNRSINDASCISNSQWAEFILGYVINGKIESSTLLGLMNGISISFRFVLDNGDYRETKFSLSGSKHTMQTAFGQDIIVTTSPR